MDVSRDEHSHDVHLARQIVAGSLDAWHGFVKDYSSLIYAIARRYLVDFDEETRRDAYVAILEYMYSHGLAKYDGRAAMSTWVMKTCITTCKVEENEPETPGSMFDLRRG